MSSPAYSTTAAHADATPSAARKTRTLTIAVVAPSLEILGGQGVQAKALMDELRACEFKVMFVPVNPAFPRGLRWLRKIPLLRTVLNQLMYIPSLLRLRHADVVHAFSASYWSFLLAPTPAILAARLFRKPVVLNYHSGEAGDHLEHWGLRVHPWLKLVDKIVVPSCYLQQIFAQYGYSTRVIRNMIDTARFSYRERDPLQPKLLSSRNLEPLYGVDNTLKAFALIKKQYPDATLTVAGYGSQEAYLKAWVQANRLKDVRFVGRVEPPDMPKLYDEADIFLNSSTIDNQPVSILEAFSAGLAVVSTPTGDIAAMLLNGARGQLVPPNDPIAMAAAVSAALDQPADITPMMRRARNEAERYTGPMVCHEWAEVYAESHANNNYRTSAA